MTAARALLAAVDAQTPAMLGQLSELIRIPSISGDPAECDIQERLAARFRADGLDVDHWPLPLQELQADPNFPGMEVARSRAHGLVARLRGAGGGPTLMFNAHVDVVPPGDPDSWQRDPFSGETAGDFVLGRGACDMKGGLAAAAGAIRALQRAGVVLRGDILLACVAGEEDGGLGTFATLSRGWRADACVVPEPTGLDLVPACAGALTFRLRVPGLATHASRRTDGVSALEKLWPVMRALGELEAERNARVDPLLARWRIAYPLSIGVVRTGDWASTVPDMLIAEGRLGVALDEATDTAREALENVVARACASDPWLRTHPVSVQWWGGQFAPGRLLPGSDLGDRLRTAHEIAGGGEMSEWGAPYGSDLRLLAAAGIPTVLYGPGDSAVAHGSDERVPITEVIMAARTLALLALDICG